jgi:hypothetical protein
VNYTERLEGFQVGVLNIAKYRWHVPSDGDRELEEVAGPEASRIPMF